MGAPDHVTTQPPAGLDQGQVAYEAYCASTGGRSAVSGATLPGWEDQSPEIRTAWRAAASAVAGLYQLDIRRSQ